MAVYLFYFIIFAAHKFKIIKAPTGFMDCWRPRVRFALKRINAQSSTTTALILHIYSINLVVNTAGLSLIKNRKNGRGRQRLCGKEWE